MSNPSAANDRPRAARTRASAATALALLMTVAACRGSEAPSRPDTSGTTTSPPPTTGTTSGVTPGATPTYTATVVRRLPHDPGAFTEGLFVLDGQLYESTGLEGKSEIRRVDLQTGAVVQRRAIAPQYFGEGIVAFGGKLYELTWKSQKGFVYDLKTFAPLDTFTYYGEGWALTTDGESLIMSDGTARLRFLDPRTLQVRRTLDVHDGPSPVSQLNELEWVKGEILANIWQSDQIARIDPKTGAVTGWIDLTGILPASERTGREDVLNGIAYDAATDKLYVTGKYWGTMFEIAVQGR